MHCYVISFSLLHPLFSPRNHICWKDIFFCRCKHLFYALNSTKMTREAYYSSTFRPIIKNNLKGHRPFKQQKTFLKASSRIWYLGSGAFLTPGSWIWNRFFRIPDPRSQNHFLESLVTIVWVKFYNSLKIDPTFFLQLFKNEIIFNCVKFVMGKNQDPG
jgi:hypothetical protein